MRGAPLSCLFTVSSSTGFFKRDFIMLFLSFTTEATDYTSTGLGPSAWRRRGGDDGEGDGPYHGYGQTSPLVYP